MNVSAITFSKVFFSLMPCSAALILKLFVKLSLKNYPNLYFKSFQLSLRILCSLMQNLSSLDTTLAASN